MNLLLVDDEVFALEALKNAVPWNSCGIDKVFTCSNITAAKKICIEESIHLIICDIEMPNGSGMDLAAWLSQNHPEILILFLTCHSDFGYAREAISYKAFAYLLKPFDIEELTKNVTKAVNQIQQTQIQAAKNKPDKIALKKQSVSEHFWHRILQNVYENSTADYIQWEAERQNISFHPDSVYIPILFYITSAFPADMEVNILLFCIKNAIEEIFHPTTELPPVLDLDSHYFLLLVHPQQIVNETSFRENCDKLLLFLHDQFQVTLQYLIGKKGTYLTLPKQLTLLKGQAEISLSSTDETEILRENPQQIVERIMALIKENKTISRESLANEVYLSTDYMSKLFKRETGKKLSEYISEVKLEEAKYLLTETSLSVSKIASSLAYSNFSYFSKMFKSETGISPGDYRKRFGKEN